MAVLMLSIAGGFISSIFLAIQNKIYKYTSANFVTTINTMVIFCFVIPFFKILSYADHSSQYLREENLIVWAEQGSQKEWLYSTMDKISFADSITWFWFVGVIVYLLYETGSYFFFLYHIQKRREALVHKVWLTAFHQVCSENSFAEGVDLFTCDIIGQPCVTGIRKPMILIPYHLLDILKPEEIKMVLCHELTHIKKRDVFFKFFISLLNSLNWFNPLFYVLKENLSEWIEIACDEDVIFFMDMEQKRLYVNTLVKLNEQQWEQQQNKKVLCFNNQNLKNFKRRVWGIMKKNSLGNQFSKAVVFTLMVGVISGGSVIAKAADYPVNGIFSNHLDVLDPEEYSVEDVNEDLDNSNLYSFVDFNDENLNSQLENDADSFTGFNTDTNTTYLVVNENGEIESLLDDSDISPKHVHDYKKVNITEHKKNKDGSCKETIYEGKRCKSCNKTVKGNVIDVVTHTNCLH